LLKNGDFPPVLKLISTSLLSLKFEVKEKSQTPEVGNIPPKIHTKIISDKSSLSLITSDINPKPDLYKFDFHEIIGEKPIVINFSTPSLCKSGTCSPIIENIKKLSEEFKENIVFIHVEIYDNPKEILDSGNPNLGKISEAVTEWNLPSEPWTFLVNSSGKIVSKHESFIGYEELKKMIQNLK